MDDGENRLDGKEDWVRQEQLKEDWKGGRIK